MANERRGPFRDYRRIGAIRVLPGTKDVEVTEPDGLKTINIEEHPRIEFIHILGHRIGRQRLSNHALHLGQTGMIAISGTRCSIHKPGYAAIARCDEHVEKARDVVFVGQRGVVD